MSAETHGKHVEVVVVPSEKGEQRFTRRKHRPASYDRGVQIAAAKVRVATDKKLGEKTPLWIVELSREEKSASAS